MNELELSESTTILLGLRPLDLPRPVTFVCDVNVEAIEVESVLLGTLQPFSRVVSQGYKVYAGGSLFATTTKAILKRDSNHVTLRLFKNKTVTYEKPKFRDASPA